ncbi:gamma-glutamyl-phosphate reductase [Erysipelotrichaceae bacterium]|nr:gamma-glutamyl-phosphate reductase [Erysipelotrichaceae bacterium]
MTYIDQLGASAKQSAKVIATLSTATKNKILVAVAEELLKSEEEILTANAKDLELACSKGKKPAYVDRLALTSERIIAMAEGVREIATASDPIGIIDTGWLHPKGMEIIQKRVPLGVIGMIFESRPNVTIDAAALAIKAGNAIILRGGSDAIYSNTMLKNIFVRAGIAAGMPPASVQLVEQTERAHVRELISLNNYIDVIIPRGGKGLKSFIIEHATVPVIETGAGNCHLYVEKSADLEKAYAIILNAKTQRPATCNTIETLLLDYELLVAFLPIIAQKLADAGVVLAVDLTCMEILNKHKIIAEHATSADYKTEYQALKITIVAVGGVEDAINHINTYGSGHSEAILTEKMAASDLFAQEVDASSVYINASTRFTDGAEFGFGGEIGISTQKLHARGPMGLRALTTYKYIIRGNGQIR